ncbi:MAG: hypothetical protein GY828_04340 [Candidatus Gracilibacteria bacterium]|nr:hypothetical protein [Candidatus Gracilibacteria bacterium]
MKTIKIIFLLFIVTILTNTAYAASVDTIEVQNSNEIDLTLSSDITVDPTVNGEVKVLKDIIVAFSVRDASDHNKVILTLEQDMTMLTSYNLLSIFGADGNIDFKTEKSLQDVELINSFVPDDQGIVKVVTVDERTLEVYFQNPVDDTEFEFKLFSEIFIDSIDYLTANKVKLHLENKVVPHSQYMLMMLSLQDNTMSNISFDEELYNFSTGENIEEVKQDAPIIDDNGETVIELDNIALNAAETPDTGAETWVLVALTLLVNAGLYMRRKTKA